MTGAATSTTVALGTVTLERLVRYAGASGDFNRLHYDAEFARKAGMKAPILHGMFGAALLLSALARDAENAELVTAEFRYRRPVLLGAELTAVIRRDGATAAAELTGGSDEVATAAVVSFDPGAVPDEPLETGDEEFPWTVEIGAARAYAEATDYPGPVAVGAPVPFMSIGLCGRWSPARTGLVRRLGFDLTRMLHRQSRYHLLGDPVVAGETLTVRQGVGGRGTRRGADGRVSRTGTVVQEILDAGGSVRARISHQMLERPAPEG